MCYGPFENGKFVGSKFNEHFESKIADNVNGFYDFRYDNDYL